MDGDHPILELASLPGRHPVVGGHFLQKFGDAILYRLRFEPVPRPPQPRFCLLSIRYLPRDTVRDVEFERRIGWTDLPEYYDDDYIARAKFTGASRRITEEAALVIMALLLHDLEGATILTVIEEGDAGDYFVEYDDGSRLPIEVSGIVADDTGYESTSRLTKKSEQVLGKDADRALVSVTTFDHQQTGRPLSILHHVKRWPRGGRGKSQKRGAR